MTTGTKVFLAVFALFVGVMVLYYGVIMPSGAEVANAELEAAATKLPAEPEQSEHLPTPAPQRNAVPRIDSSMPTAASPQPDPSALEEISMGGPTGEPAALPVGLDPTRMLPLLTVDESPIEDSAAEGAPLQLTDKQLSLPEKEVAAPAPNPVRPNTPVTLDGAPTRPGVSVKPRAQPKAAATGEQTRTPTPPKTTEYIVKSGDTMMTIAKDWFGDENKWSLIAKANPWVDPARMQIGQKLQLPEKNARPEPIKTQAAAEKADKSIYIVRSGDTLAKIAREFYGNVAKWELIYNANRSVIGDDPAALQVGMKLTLPKNR